MRIRDKSDLLSAISVYIDKTDNHQRSWIRQEIYNKADETVAKVSPGPGRSILLEYYAGNNVSVCLTSMWHIQNIIEVPCFAFFNETYITMTRTEKE